MCKKSAEKVSFGVGIILQPQTQAITIQPFISDRSSEFYMLGIKDNCSIQPL